MPITGCIVPITSLVALVTLISNSLRNWSDGWHHLALATIIMITLLSCVVFTNLFARNATDAHLPFKLWSILLDSFSFQLYLLIIGLTPYAAITRQLIGQTKWTKTQHGAAHVANDLKRSYQRG